MPDEVILSYHPEVRIDITLSDGRRIEVGRHLGDQGSVVIHKHLYAPAAEFHINLPDMPFAPFLSERESLYGLVNPVDPITIYMRRWKEPAATVGPWEPVLRGFVRSVGRHEQIAGDGRPQRMVVIAGNDCGAVFLMEQLRAIITYYTTGNWGQIPPFTWMTEYNLSAEPMPVSDFIWELAYNTTRDIMETAGYEFQRLTTVRKGYALAQYALASEGPVWQYLRRYSDPPWNELFVREGAEQPELVFRPTPWRDIDDQPLEDGDLSNVLFYQIYQADIVSLTAHRDDSELVEWAHVLSPGVMYSGNTVPLELATLAFNSELRAKFGDRLQELTTHLGPGLYEVNLPEADQMQSFSDYNDWVRDRVEWVGAAGRHIHDFERGILTVKGRPHYQVGNYIRVFRGGIVWEGYITAVTHDYQGFKRYLTRIEYIRGNQILVRRRTPNPWDVERAIFSYDI